MPDFTELNEKKKTEIKDNIADPILTSSTPSGSKNNAGIVVGIIAIIIVFLCVVDFSNSTLESGEIMGNLMMTAAVFGLIMFFPLLILISFIVIDKNIDKKNSNIKLQENMNREANSGSGLSKFIEKTDIANLKGVPKDFYEAGIVFVEKGQFDDGIMEFVKVIKTASLEDNLYVLAQKELENMGFSKMDIENARQTKNA
jgi:uncharacterized membrane protein